jgi:NAD(P)-dependent dehydrogenase (short-subunit alcohol dehydrogenase family)
MTTTSNMEGTIVITGAAGGIGNGWLMEHLKSPQAKSHHTIYIIHPTAPGNLQQTLDRYAPKEHKYEIIPLDLSKQEDIRSMGKGLNERIAAGELRRIQLLLLIAGAMFLSPSTKDGISWTEGEIESTFAVNYLANFLLVLLLLRSMDDSFARIIFIGSTSHDPSFLSNQGAFTKPEMKIMFKGKGGVEDVEWVARVKEEIEKGDEFPAAVRRYGRSKLCMTMFMYVILHSIFKKVSD